MKKNFFLQVILLTSVFTLLLSGCIKEKLVIPRPADETVSAVDTRVTIGNWGSVTGLALPANTVIGIEVFNADFLTKEFYFSDDGKFRLDKIPAGIYTVRIRYILPDQYPVTDTPTTNTGVIAEHLVPDIKVRAGSITDVGMIKLPQN